MRKPVIILLGMAVLLSSTYLAADTSSDATGQPVSSENNSYNVSTPFRINSNAEFAAMAISKGWPGDGSQGSPYVIDNYDINGTGYGDCIFIGNTTCNFTVQNCYLHHATGTFSEPYFTLSGLALYNVKNSSIKNNIVMYDVEGIYGNLASNNLFSNNTVIQNSDGGLYLTASPSNNITDNNCSNNLAGICFISSSNYNTAFNNIANSSSYYGFYISSSNQNTITNNTISTNIKRGLYLSSASNNAIANNTVSSNNQYGIYLSSSSSNTIYHNNIINNTNQAYDNSNNNWWNSSYPVGGNHWSNYAGVDYYSGPNQDQPGSDNIGDAQYSIDADSYDRYPLFDFEPKIIVTAPYDNAQYVSPKPGTYVIQFNKIMNTLVGTISTDLPGIVWTWSANGGWLNGTYNQLQNFTSYYVDLTGGGFLDAFGNPLTGDTYKNFTTSDEKHPGPLRINSNADFAACGKCSGGDGSVGNPWIIENYDINGSGYGYCIYIGNTTNYFTVQNCSLHHASGNSATYFWNSGMALNNVVNGVATNNTVYNNGCGIYLRTSNSNAIYRNNIINNTNQAYDNSNNNWWNSSYPTGGNYWSNYAGVDYYSGLNQDQPGSDNIGDTPYVIDTDSSDQYPLLIHSEPEIVRTVPADNTVYVSLRPGTYVIQFNKSMNKTVGTISTNLPGVVWSWSVNCGWFNGSYSQLQNNTIYFVDLTGGGFVDGFGNPLTGDLYKNFTAGYEPHAPIFITSNSNFASQAASNGWPGDGTQGNPYIIQNYEINGSTSGYCIAIQSTTVYFTIQNCYLHNSSGQDYKGIDFYVVKNGTITGNVFSKNYMGMYFYQSGYCTIINNTFSDNVMGFRCFYDYRCFHVHPPPAPDVGNNITENIFLNNTQLGVLIDFTADIYNTLGLPPAGIHDIIYRNNFINNSLLLPPYAWAIGTWNWDYPIGGNYWTNYTGYDNFSGPNQDIPGSDGIGDTPFSFFDSPFECVDHYPLMHPIQVNQPNITNFEIPVVSGWNLISTPLIPGNITLPTPLLDQDRDTFWVRVQYYNTSDASDQWKQWYSGWPTSLNDLTNIDHKKGIWIYVTALGDGYINVTGTMPTSTSIPIKAGWNLVGYPTLNTTMTVANALWGTGADKVEVCDPTDPYRTKEVGPTYLMKPGEGYWLHVPADTTWIINW